MEIYSFFYSKPPATSDDSLNPRLNYFNNTKF